MERVVDQPWIEDLDLEAERSGSGAGAEAVEDLAGTREGLQRDRFDLAPGESRRLAIAGASPFAPQRLDRVVRFGVLLGRADLGQTALQADAVLAEDVVAQLDQPAGRPFVVAGEVGRARGDRRPGAAQVLVDVRRDSRPGRRPVWSLRGFEQSLGGCQSLEAASFTA